MQIKLNCENRVIIQGRVKKLTEDKFILKSELVTIPCRIDCRLPMGLKEDDQVTVYAKLRYSNDNDTHKLILERVLICDTKTPINFISLEGYPIEPINSCKGVLSWMLRHNVLHSSGDIYRCLIEIYGYGKVAERIGSFIKPEELYMIVGSLASKNNKIVINVEYMKDSTAIVRSI
jgi:hypothetical protein